MRLAALRDAADLEAPYGHAGVTAVEMRVQAGRSAQNQGLPGCVERPDTGERSIHSVDGTCIAGRSREE
jgi:hypothetical protein